MISNCGFSEGQLAHLDYLASLPPDAKCKCGWAAKGDCYNCGPEDGGFVRCGAVNRKVSDEPCCRKRGHDGAHGGFRRQGAGGYTVNWPQEDGEAFASRSEATRKSG